MNGPVVVVEREDVIAKALEVLAMLFFLLAAGGVTFGPVNFVACGLACWVASSVASWLRLP